MCPCWLAGFYTCMKDYVRHCQTNYTLLHYLADLFKLFIILNYIYFAYMIYCKLWQLVKKCFERKPKCPECCERKRSRSRSRSTSCSDLLSKPRPCAKEELECTCFKSSSKQTPPKVSRSSSSTCNVGKKNSVCTLFKSGTPASEKKSSGGKTSCSCASSVERIQVEFNCKPKKTRKTARDNKAMKSRSCTKCGKNLSSNSSKCGMSRVPLPTNTCSRKSNCPRC